MFRSDMVVLGGTQERDQFSLEPNEDDCKGILERCCKLVPSLKNAKILKKQAGLRPLRKGGIRLEMEVVVVGEKKVCKVIHNYGHGGSGVTLCWGCANEVCDIIKRDINLRASSNL
jgi:glycine/D-amino acid oxidase-like deaminating enzyme